ncbi:hypothetical protein HY375_04060 [Candidatus Berkelbacteria bacterium]|nr:hypothetical protein [Candidatus Berkelbacteria bacterium]
MNLLEMERKLQSALLRLGHRCRLELRRGVEIPGFAEQLGAEELLIVTQQVGMLHGRNSFATFYLEDGQMKLMLTGVRCDRLCEGMGSTRRIEHEGLAGTEVVLSHDSFEERRLVDFLHRFSGASSLKWLCGVAPTMEVNLPV